MPPDFPKAHRNFIGNKVNVENLLFFLLNSEPTNNVKVNLLTSDPSWAVHKLGVLFFVLSLSYRCKVCNEYDIENNIKVTWLTDWNSRTSVTKPTCLFCLISDYSTNLLVFTLIVLIVILITKFMVMVLPRELVAIRKF